MSQMIHAYIYYKKIIQNYLKKTIRTIIKMSKNSSAKYYQKIKEKRQKSCEKYQDLSEEEKYKEQANIC